jgi:hypothetical protein
MRSQSLRRPLEMELGLASEEQGGVNEMKACFSAAASTHVLSRGRSRASMSSSDVAISKGREGDAASLKPTTAGGWGARAGGGGGRRRLVPVHGGAYDITLASAMAPQRAS